MAAALKAAPVSDLAPPAPDPGDSLELEQSLLGALMIAPQAFPKISHIVSLGDFYAEDHGVIFGNIATMHERGELVDLVTLSDRFRRDCDPEIGQRLVALICQFATNCPSAANAVRYAELVREKSLSRRLHSVGLEIARAVRGRDRRSLPELVAWARGAILEVADSAQIAGRIVDLGAEELINLELPELEPLLEPFLFQKNLAMVHSRRGVGKTHFALGVSFAISAGATYLCYRAPKPRGVLFIDGEMPAQLMRQRLKELVSAYGCMPDLLRIVTPDVQERPMPDLATPGGQAEIDGLVRPDTALIVVDNLSCLVRSGGLENEADSWTAVANWALKHRRAGRALLFVHHSGKTGTQRGTSKREDLLDVVINLRRPVNYHESDGAIFTIHFEKARSLTGDSIAPIEARLEQLLGDAQGWTWRLAETVGGASIRELWEVSGMSVIDVAKEVHQNKSTVHRELERAMRMGELKRAYPAHRKKKEGG